jgi:hypothetical protein
MGSGARFEVTSGAVNRPWLRRTVDLGNRVEPCRRNKEPRKTDVAAVSAEEGMVYALPTERGRNIVSRLSQDMASSRSGPGCVRLTSTWITRRGVCQ